MVLWGKFIGGITSENFTIVYGFSIAVGVILAATVAYGNWDESN